MAKRPTTRRQERQIRRVRNIVIALVVAVALGVIGYGTYYSAGVTVGEYRPGTHYQVIDDARGRRPGEPVVVREFFSYACPHCRNFEPLLNDWQQHLPKDVVLERTPVAYSTEWSLLARAFYTLKELHALDPNHQRIFEAIHDQGRQFPTPESLADFVDGYGVSKDEFLRTFQSASVDERMREAARDQQALGITSVPTLVVDDKYRVDMEVGRKVALDVVDHLIAQEQSQDG